MVGRCLLDDRICDVEPEVGRRRLEDLGEPPALERRRGPLPEPLVDRGEGGDEFVFAGRIETVGGEAPEIEQVRLTEVSRGQGPAPVENDSRQHHGGATLSPRLEHVRTRPDGAETGVRPTICHE